MKVLVFNLENFFIFMDKYKGQDIEKMDEFTWQHLPSGIKLNKSLEKVRKITFIIEKHDPDVLMLTEVGGSQSLNEWNKYFLQDKYQVHHIASNSDRGIDMGFLVKKDKFKHSKLSSFKKRPINFLYPNDIKAGVKLKPSTSLKFSRDVLFLQTKFNHRDIGFLLVHLKSKWDKSGQDPQGYLRREAELKELIRIYKELKQQFKMPLMIGGDFNGFAGLPKPDIEFKSLYEQTQLKDLLETFNLDQNLRFTHIHKKRTGQIYPSQLDYLFLDEDFQKILTKAEVDHFPDFINCEPTVDNLANNRSLLPSDHFPLIADFSL